MEHSGEQKSVSECGDRRLQLELYFKSEANASVSALNLCIS